MFGPANNHCFLETVFLVCFVLFSTSAPHKSLNYLSTGRPCMNGLNSIGSSKAQSLSMKKAEYFFTKPGASGAAASYPGDKESSRPSNGHGLHTSQKQNSLGLANGL